MVKPDNIKLWAIRLFLNFYFRKESDIIISIDRFPQGKLLFEFREWYNNIKNIPDCTTLTIWWLLNNSSQVISCWHLNNRVFDWSPLLAMLKYLSIKFLLKSVTIKFFPIHLLHPSFYFYWCIEYPYIHTFPCNYNGYMILSELCVSCYGHDKIEKDNNLICRINNFKGSEPGGEYIWWGLVKMMNYKGQSSMVADIQILPLFLINIRLSTYNSIKKNHSTITFLDYYLFCSYNSRPTLRLSFAHTSSFFQPK